MTRAPDLKGPSGYHVGDIVIDMVRRRVSRGDREIRVGKLSYKLLVALAAVAPRVATREELAARVWDGRYVNPATLKRRVALLRAALGDDAGKPAYVSVVRGHGYGLIPLVEPIYEAHGWTDACAPLGDSEFTCN